MTSTQDSWSTDVAPSSLSHSLYPGEIPLYHRDCVLLIDGAVQFSDDDSITNRLKQIKFHKWCTGPPQRANDEHKSNCTVVETLRDIGHCTDSPVIGEQDYRYRPLQRYYSLKGRLQNDRSLSIFRRERFKLKYPENHFHSEFIPIDTLDDGVETYSECDADYIISTQRHLEEQTRNDPHNVLLWCKFADFYQDTVTLHQTRGRHHHKMWKTSLTKQTAIYEKAVEYNRNSTLLLLRKLDLYGMHHDDDEVHLLWRSAMERNPFNTKLWTEYLHFEITKTRNEWFDEERSVDAVVRDAIRSLNTAKKKMFSTIKFHDGPDSVDLRSHLGSTERTLLSLFMTHCRFQWSAGFKWKAVAMLQALIEFNIFGPTQNAQIADHFERNIVYFQLFWESECCRVGESAAVGFTQFVDLMLNSEHNEEDKQSLLSLFNQRQSVEIVLFDEIRGFLFELNDPDLQNELIFNTLDLIGIDDEDIGKSSECFSSEFGADSLFIEDWKELIDSTESVDLEFLEKTTDSTLKMDNEWKMEFALNILRSMDSHRKSSKSMTTSLLCSMVMITLRLKGPSECKSLCKSLLQRDPFNLPLYSIYAQIEWKSTGKMKAAVRVYQNALKLLHRVPVEQRCYGPMLFFEYFKLEIFGRNESEQSLNALIKILVSAAHFEFTVIPSTKKKKKENKEQSSSSAEITEIAEAMAIYNDLMKQKDASFWKSTDDTLIPTDCNLFDSRSPSAYFFIFGFALKLMTTQQHIENVVEFVTLHLFEQKSTEFIGNRITNQSEIEFILHFVLKLIGWRISRIRTIWNYNQCILDLVKRCCSLYPKNRYFLFCVERYGRGQFEILSIYKSLMISRHRHQLVPWIKFLIFRITNGASSSSVIAAFNDGLLMAECRHSVVFWRLYLCYLWNDHQQQFGREILCHDDDGRKVDGLSRYQRQRMQRRKKLVLDQKQQSLDRLKGTIQMGVQTICRSKLLYLTAMGIMERCCSEEERKDFERFIRTKRVCLGKIQ